MVAPCSFIYKNEKLETTEYPTWSNWLGKLGFIHKIEYSVVIKNDVCQAFNDMRKCLWHPITCKRQEIKSDTQCDLRRVKTIGGNLRKKPHKTLLKVVVSGWWDRGWFFSFSFHLSGFFLHLEMMAGQLWEMCVFKPHSQWRGKSPSVWGPVGARTAAYSSCTYTGFGSGEKKSK